MNIGDLFLRILADTKEFEADLDKQAGAAGDKAGATLGKRLGSAVKQNGAKIIGTTMALGFGIATKGLLELENVTADFAAETGASADEADRAGKAINAMAGRNLQPLNEIGAALTKVHTDMGLTGDEAERTTQQFLTFGRATKQNAATAVKAFDDILDAWNLTAKDAGGLMDKLVISHQKFGGSIEANQSALAALAPSLQAANLKIDDGIALLNLFEASGVDSAVAVTGMTKALSKVKSPEELKALIADIIATEDPFLRAQKAADLFGAKAGAKLANALRPGQGGLEAFTVSTDEAVGATQKAADVLDSTWGSRFQLMIKAAGSAITGFGASFGAGLTGLASLASLIASSGLAPKLLQLGKDSGSALADGLQSVWSGAGGTVIGNNIASRVENIMDPTKSTVIGNTWRKLGSKAGTVYLKALFAGDALSSLLSKAWTATGGRAIEAAGISGTAAGRAFGLAASAAIIALPVIAITAIVKFGLIDVKDQLDKQTSELSDQTRKFATAATTEGLLKAKADITAQKDSLNILGFIPIDAFGVRGRIDEQLAILEHELVSRTKDMDSSVQAASGDIGTALAALAHSAANLATQGGASLNTVGTAAERLKDNVKRAAATMVTTVHNLTTKLLGEALALINGYYDPLIAQEELRVQKDQVAADKIALAAAKAGSAQRHEAQLTLTKSQQALDQTRANLLASGTLTAAEQKTWLAELKSRYKTATGAAKADIAALIAKLGELARVTKPGFTVRIQSDRVNYGNPLGGRAAGGPVTAGVPYIVGERRPELFVPDTNGRIIDRVPAMSPSGTDGMGGATYNVTVNNPTPRAADADIGRILRRTAALGITA